MFTSSLNILSYCKHTCWKPKFIDTSWYLMSNYEISESVRDITNIFKSIRFLESNVDKQDANKYVMVLTECWLGRFAVDDVFPTLYR